MITAWLLAAGLAALAGCQSYRAVRRLGPEHADFLAKVDYIITKAERKIFLELPESDRDDFIEEFWRRRDPDRDTARNEFRLEYEDRVAKAEAMFLGEGRPGWKTDRGRIFILFGPPHERLTYPMDASGYCREVWYYGAFPVIFVDQHCSGYFVLTAINLEHLQELNIAQGHFQKTLTDEGRLFDYHVSMLKTRVEGGVYEGVVFVDIPYETIWFTFEDGLLETGFEVRLEVSDGSGTPVWEARGTFPLSLEEKELVENRKRNFRMEFPLRIDRDLDRLRGEKLRMDISVRSTTEGEELKKAVAFELKFEAEIQPHDP
ncbi:MAG: GWxTD domain-containing protein [Candidatus Aminicenantes bacterium]|nr:GWxTD domain-containing protein [Candidatus Aminicenantes bacterium]